jgi:N-acyl-D-aspartate/D-glutamate deacylase
VRSEVVGDVNRKPTPAELDTMRARRTGMKDGALGMSTGLFYVPGTFHGDR